MANRILTKGRHTVPADATWAIQSGKGTVTLSSPTIGFLGTLKLNEVDLSYKPALLGSVPDTAATYADLAAARTAVQSLIDQINDREGFIGLPVTQNTVIEVLGSSYVFVEDEPVISGPSAEVINGAGVAAERTLRIRVSGTGTFDNVYMHGGDGAATLRTYSDDNATEMTDELLLNLNELDYPFELDNDSTAIGAIDLELSSGSSIIITGNRN